MDASWVWARTVQLNWESHMCRFSIQDWFWLLQRLPRMQIMLPLRGLLVMRWASTSLCITIWLPRCCGSFTCFATNFLILRFKYILMWVDKKCWCPISQWSESQDMPFWRNWYCKCLWGFGRMIGWDCSIFTTGQATGTLSSTTAHDWFLSFCRLYSMHRTFLSLQALGLVVAVVWVSSFLPFRFFGVFKYLL